MTTPDSIIKIARNLDDLKRAIVHLDGKLPKANSETYRQELTAETAAFWRWLERWQQMAERSGIKVYE